MTTTSDIETEALDRARSSRSMANFAAIYAGFTAMGIPEADILPRENVLTYNAWRALGRQVRRGEHGVSVPTFITITRGEGDDARTFQRPRTTTVFHISQTDALRVD